MGPPSHIMQSFILPTLSQPGAESVRIAQATHRPVEVVLRVIGPPGEWAAFSYDPVELNVDQGLVPVGNTIIIPSGQFQPLHLRPRQVIYAKGSHSLTAEFPVCVSVTMTESIV
jgi:hypothetical protein